MGMLIEAQESYLTLSHRTLPPQASSAFRDAKEKGRAELARLSPRVPTLRVTTSPAATTLKNVVVQVNGPFRASVARSNRPRPPRVLRR